MENELYYTPTIEEFHIGFEYECNRSSFGNLAIPEQFRGWHKYAVTSYAKLSEIDTSIRFGEIRVKYLDKSDLEELGWNKHTNEDIYLYFHGNPEPHKLKFWDKDRVMIYCYTDDYYKCFDGVIKNKSELNRLMKQLNILK